MQPPGPPAAPPAAPPPDDDDDDNRISWIGKRRSEISDRNPDWRPNSGANIGSDIGAIAEPYWARALKRIGINTVGDLLESEANHENFSDLYPGTKSPRESDFTAWRRRAGYIAAPEDQRMPDPESNKPSKTTDGGVFRDFAIERGALTPKPGPLHGPDPQLSPAQPPAGWAGPADKWSGPTSASNLHPMVDRRRREDDDENSYNDRIARQNAYHWKNTPVISRADNARRTDEFSAGALGPQVPELAKDRTLEALFEKLSGTKLESNTSISMVNDVDVGRTQVNSLTGEQEPFLQNAIRVQRRLDNNRVEDHYIVQDEMTGRVGFVNRANPGGVSIVADVANSKTGEITDQFDVVQDILSATSYTDPKTGKEGRNSIWNNLQSRGAQWSDWTGYGHEFRSKMRSLLYLGDKYTAGDTMERVNERYGSRYVKWRGSQHAFKNEDILSIQSRAVRGDEVLYALEKNKRQKTRGTSGTEGETLSAIGVPAPVTQSPFFLEGQIGVDEGVRNTTAYVHDKLIVPEGAMVGRETLVSKRGRRRVSAEVAAAFNQQMADGLLPAYFQGGYTPSRVGDNVYNAGSTDDFWDLLGTRRSAKAAYVDKVEQVDGEWFVNYRTVSNKAAAKKDEKAEIQTVQDYVLPTVTVGGRTSQADYMTAALSAEGVPQAALKAFGTSIGSTDNARDAFVSWLEEQYGSPGSRSDAMNSLVKQLTNEEYDLEDQEQRAKAFNSLIDERGMVRLPGQEMFINMAVDRWHDDDQVVTFENRATSYTDLMHNLTGWLQDARDGLDADAQAEIDAAIESNDLRQVASAASRYGNTMRLDPSRVKVDESLVQSTNDDGTVNVRRFDSEGDDLGLRPVRYEDGKAVDVDNWEDADNFLMPNYNAVVTPKETRAQHRPEFSRREQYIKPEYMAELKHANPEVHATLVEMARNDEGMTNEFYYGRAVRANYLDSARDKLEEHGRIHDFDVGLFRQAQGEALDNYEDDDAAIERETLRNYARLIQEKTGKRQSAIAVNTANGQMILPTAESAAATFTEDESGRLMRGPGSDVLKALHAAAEASDYGDDDILAAKRDEAVNKALVSSFDYLEEEGVREKEQSMELRRIGGKVIADAAVPEDMVVTSLQALMEQTRMSEEEIRQRTSDEAYAEGRGLTLSDTRFPTVDPDIMSPTARVGVYEHLAEQESPIVTANGMANPEYAMVVAPVRAQAQQGDFDADEMIAIANAHKLADGRIVQNNGAVTDPSVLRGRSRRQVESEYEKQIKESKALASYDKYADAVQAAGREGWVGIEDSFEKFISGELKGSKELGQIYNAFVRNSRRTAMAVAGSVSPELEKAVSVATGSTGAFTGQVSIDSGLSGEEGGDPYMRKLFDMHLRLGVGENGWYMKALKDRDGESIPGTGRSLGGLHNVGARILNNRVMAGSDKDWGEYRDKLADAAATEIIPLDVQQRHLEAGTLDKLKEDVIEQVIRPAHASGKGMNQELRSKLLELTERKNIVEWTAGIGDDPSTLTIAGMTVLGAAENAANKRSDEHGGPFSTPFKAIRSVAGIVDRAKGFIRNVANGGDILEGLSNAQQEPGLSEIIEAQHGRVDDLEAAKAAREAFKNSITEKPEPIDPEATTPADTSSSEALRSARNNAIAWAQGGAQEGDDVLEQARAYLGVTGANRSKYNSLGKVYEAVTGRELGDRPEEDALSQIVDTMALSRPNELKTYPGAPHGANPYGGASPSKYGRGGSDEAIQALWMIDTSVLPEQRDEVTAHLLRRSMDAENPEDEILTLDDVFFQMRDAVKRRDQNVKDILGADILTQIASNAASIEKATVNASDVGYAVEDAVLKDMLGMTPREAKNAGLSQFDVWNAKRTEARGHPDIILPAGKGRALLGDVKAKNKNTFAKDILGSESGGRISSQYMRQLGIYHEDVAGQVFNINGENAMVDSDFAAIIAYNNESMRQDNGELPPREAITPEMINTAREKSVEQMVNFYRGEMPDGYDEATWKAESKAALAMMVGEDDKILPDAQPVRLVPKAHMQEELDRVQSVIDGVRDKALYTDKTSAGTVPQSNMPSASGVADALQVALKGGEYNPPAVGARPNRQPAPTVNPKSEEQQELLSAAKAVARDAKKAAISDKPSEKETKEFLSWLENNVLASGGDGEPPNKPPSDVAAAAGGDDDPEDENKKRLREAFQAFLKEQGISQQAGGEQVTLNFGDTYNSSAKASAPAPVEKADVFRSIDAYNKLAGDNVNDIGMVEHHELYSKGLKPIRDMLQRRKMAANKKTAAQVFHSPADNAFMDALEESGIDIDDLEKNLTVIDANYQADAREIATALQNKPSGSGRQLTQRETANVAAAKENLAGLSDVMKELSEVTEGFTKIQGTHLEQIKTLTKSYETLDSAVETLAKFNQTGKATAETREQEAALRESRDAAAGNVARLMSAEARVSGGQQSIALSDEEHQAKMLDALMAGGRTGIKRRQQLTEEDYKRGIDLGIGNIEIQGEGSVKAAGQAMRFTSKLRGALWAMGQVDREIISPLVGGIENYEARAGARELMLAQSGEIGYDDLISGSYGDRMRRRSSMEYMQEEQGRQAYNTYAGLLSMTQGNEQGLGRTLGALQSISAPAISAAVMGNTMGGPAAGAIAGAGALALGTMNYFAQSTQDIAGLGDTMNTINQIKNMNGRGPLQAIGGVAQILTQDFFGAASLGLSSFGSLLSGEGVVADDVEAYAAAQAEVEAWLGEGTPSVLDVNYTGQSWDDYRWENRHRDDINMDNLYKEWRLNNVVYTGGDKSGAEIDDVITQLTGDDTLGPLMRAQMELQKLSPLAGGQEAAIDMSALRNVYFDGQSIVSGDELSDNVIGRLTKHQAAGFAELPQTLFQIGAATGISGADVSGIAGIGSALADRLDELPVEERPLEKIRIQAGVGLAASVNPALRRAGMDILDEDFILNGQYRDDPTRLEMFGSLRLGQAGARLAIGQERGDAYFGAYSERLQGYLDQGDSYNFFRTSEQGEYGAAYLGQRRRYGTQFDEAGFASWITSLSSDQFKVQSAILEGDPIAVQQNWEQFSGRKLGSMKLDDGTASLLGNIDLSTGGALGQYTRLTADQFAARVAGADEMGNDDYAEAMKRVGNITMVEAQREMRGMNVEMAEFQRSQQVDQFNLGRAMTAGGASELDAQGFAKLGDGLKAMADVFEKNGMNFNAGNGMGVWQIQDTQTAMQREKQQWSMEQSTRGIGLQEAQFDLAAKQFYEKIGFSEEQFAYNTGRQRNEMQIGRRQSLTQREWQREDMAFQRDQAEIGFGWNMEDFDRNLRYARGRERLDLLRQRERSVVQHSMQMGRMDVQEERFGTTSGWQDSAYERQTEHFEKTIEFQERQFEMQKRHFEEGRALEQEKMDMTRESHEREMQWLRESWQLEDQQRLLERQSYQLQSQMQQEMMDKTYETQVRMRDLQYAMEGAAAHAQKLSTFFTLMKQMGEWANTVMGDGGSPNKPPDRVKPQVTTTKPMVTKPETNQSGISEWGSEWLASLGYAEGGYTGDGAKHEVAGIVHKGEYVVPQHGALVIRGDNSELVSVMREAVAVLNRIASQPAQVNAVINTNQNRVRVGDLTMKDKAYSRLQQ